MNTCNTLTEAKKYIDSFARPTGYNNYAWDLTKRLALEVWESYLAGKPYHRRVNYLCSEFYRMIQNPINGQFIIPENSFQRFAS